MRMIFGRFQCHDRPPGRPRQCPPRVGLLGAGLLALALGGCGGGGGTDVAAADTGVIMPVVQALNPIPETPTTALAAVPVVGSGPELTPAAVLPVQGDPGLLLLLVPDGQNLADPRIGAWADAASEEGVRLQPVTDSEFIQLGAGASAFAGLILPDDLHTRATDEIIAAVTAYTQGGGRTMLVYDFGALFPRNGDWFYAVPKSRLSALAGVDYVLYDALRDRTTGLGPVTALRSTMRQLLVPPGKSLPYAGPTSLTAASASARSDLMHATGVAGDRALFLPVSPADPGGVRGYDPQQYLDVRHYSSGGLPPPAIERSGTPRVVTVDFGRAFKAPAVGGVTREAPQATREKAAAVTDPVDAYNGYILGNLIYPSYVTQGTFAGTTLAVSPQHGLVAGVNTFGQGQVLFVNMPLTYLKGRTDALPMHGFLHYFTRNMLKMAHLSAMPNAVAGLTFDWHLDSRAAQTPTLNLERLGVFSDPGALFPIEMTAGPDAVNIGDRLGWNLLNNSTAKGILQRFDKLGHSVGNHGGWIHDYYGLGVSETNQFTTTSGACRNTVTRIDNFEQCLVLNRQAVDGVIGRPSRGYSATEGNNPVWAMQWLEDRGVVAAYFGGHTGLGATRQYRDGKLLNPKIWMFPVTPQGTYATFEEWQDFGVSKTVVNQWYRDLIDFSIGQNTSRMVYAHPPGAYQWRDVLTAMLNYAKTQRAVGKFAWYTTTRLADFMETRLQVAWTQTVDAGGLTQFTVSHPASLNEMVWRLPKARYPDQPVIVSGTATVASDDAAGYWLVKAGAGASLSFTARATP